MSQKWKIVFMLSCIAALNYGDRTAISSVFPLLRDDLHLSDLALAGIGSAFLWTYAIGSPAAGYLADRLSRSRIVLFSVTAWSAVMLSTGFVHSAPVLLFMRVLLGLAECLYLPASIALIADHHDSDTRGTAMGFQIAGMSVGLIGGSTIAGYLGERFGWRVDFFALGAFGLFLGFVASFVLRDAPATLAIGPPQSMWRTLYQLVRIPAYMAIVAEAMLIAIGTWIFLNWLPLYLYERFHMSLAAAGFWSSSVLQIAGITGAVAGGFFSDRIARNTPRRRFLFLALCYLCAAPFLLSFRFNAPLLILNVSVFFYSLMQSLGQASECPIICELTAPRLRSTGIGMLNTMNCTAGGIGIMIAGFLKRSYGLGSTFGLLSVTVAVAGMIGLAAFLFLQRSAEAKNQLPRQAAQV